MQCTKLELQTTIKSLMNEKGGPIVIALKEEKEKGVTNSDTDKARTALFLEIKALIDAQGQIFKRENELAVKEMSELTAYCSLTLKQTEESIKKLHEKFDGGLAKEVYEKLKPLHKAPELANLVKAEMGKHFEWRGGLAPMGDALSKSMVERLNNAYMTWRDVPLKAFMDIKDKFAKTEEYKKRAEHFEIILKGLAGNNVNREEILKNLGKDQLQISEYMEQVGKVAVEGLGESSKGPKDIKEYAKNHSDWKTYISRLNGLQNKLKVARSQVHTAQILRDGFLKKAGSLASLEGTKKMAQAIGNDVAKMEKQVQSFQAAFETYKKEFNKVSTVKI